MTANGGHQAARVVSVRMTDAEYREIAEAASGAPVAPFLRELALAAIAAHREATNGRHEMRRREASDAAARRRAAASDLRRARLDALT